MSRLNSSPPPYRRLQPVRKVHSRTAGFSLQEKFTAVPQASACRKSSPPEGGGTPYRRLQPVRKVHRRAAGFSLQGKFTA